MSTTGMGTRLDEATIARLVEEDLGHLLHPQYYAPDHADPVIFASGEGVWLTDVRGRRYIDGLSSLWNVAVGHGRAELADAASEQMRRVAFTNNYTGFSNVPAIELARTLAGLAYDGMEGVYFTNSGSESNEAAFKTARFYWNLMGRSGKVKVVARERAYHGGHARHLGHDGAAGILEVLRAAPRRRHPCDPPREPGVRLPAERGRRMRALDRGPRSSAPAPTLSPA